MRQGFISGIPLVGIFCDNDVQIVGGREYEEVSLLRGGNS